MNKDDPLTLKAIDDLHIAVSEYERIVEKESLEDRLELLRDQVQRCEDELEEANYQVVYWQEYSKVWEREAKAQQDLSYQYFCELERARDLAVRLEAEIAVCLDRNFHNGTAEVHYGGAE
jgi:hypothetical protein